MAAEAAWLPHELSITLHRGGVLLFGLTLVGIALFHRRTLPVALAGLAAVVACKLLFIGFGEDTEMPGLVHHLAKEWVPLTNLFGLLTGFALLANHFYESKVPAEFAALAAQ